MEKKYELPELPYGYKDLEPYISEEIMTLHHDKHHAGYVSNLNIAIASLREVSQSETSGNDYMLCAICYMLYAILSDLLSSITIKYSKIVSKRQPRAFCPGNQSSLPARTNAELA